MLVRLINLGPSPALESKCIIMEKLKNTRIQLHGRLSMLSAESRAAQPASKLWRQRPEGAAAQASSNGARGKLVLALSSLPHLDFTEVEQIRAWGNTYCGSARAARIRPLGPLVQLGNGHQRRRQRSAPSTPKIYIHGLLLRRRSSKMGAHEEGGELVPGGRAPRLRGRRSSNGSWQMRELLSLSYIWEDAGGNEGSLIRWGSDESFVGAVFSALDPQK